MPISEQISISKHDEKLQNHAPNNVKVLFYRYVTYNIELIIEKASDQLDTTPVNATIYNLLDQSTYPRSTRGVQKVSTLSHFLNGSFTIVHSFYTFSW